MIVINHQDCGAAKIINNGKKFNRIIENKIHKNSFKKIDSDEKTVLVGDVCLSDMVGLVAGVTPVPGGVGPMTIACLLANTVTACYRSQDLSDPEFT